MSDFCKTVNLSPPYFLMANIRPALTANAALPVEANAVQLINRGNTVVTIDNDLTLDPGQSWELATNHYDVIRQTFQIQFGTVNVVDATPVSNRLEIVFFNRTTPLTESSKSC